jgi:cardiolipin synthase
MLLRRDKRDKQDRREMFLMYLSRFAGILVITFLALFSAHHNVFAAKITQTSDPALIVMPDDGAEPLERIISEAGKTIDIVMYRIDDPRILKAIKNTVNRGVKVRVMLEKYPSGIAGGNAAAKTVLENSGAFTAWTNPEFGLTLQRTAIVDAAAAYVSTFDFTQEAIDSSRGFVVELMDPREVLEIARIFDADWHRRQTTPENSKLAWAPQYARMRIFDLIRKARHSLLIYSERICDKDIERELGNAVKRGIDVKAIIVDDKANMPGIIGIRQAGARVRTMKRPLLRANMIIADPGYEDQTALIGSLDLSSLSLDRDRGLSVLISDPAGLKRLKEVFEKDFASAQK